MNTPHVLGDSHTDLFQPLGTVFDRGAAVITADRLIRKDSSVWTKIEPWLRAQNNQTLIVSANEVDIRGHFWRHCVNYPQGVSAYVRARAQALYQCFDQWISDYHVKKIILWAPPPACDRTTNNPEWPFVGSTVTRNQLVNLWTREFIECVKKGTGKIAIATAYYEYMDFDRWRPHNHRPTDGVHWDRSLFERFYTYLIEPLINRDQTVSMLNSKAYESVRGIEPLIRSKVVSEKNQLYDSWISVKTLAEKTVMFEGQEYYLTRQSDLESLDPGYQELTLG
jgi:hypothetical protein